MFNGDFPNGGGFIPLYVGINPLMKNKNLWFSERMASMSFSYFLLRWLTYGL